MYTTIMKKEDNTSKLQGTKLNDFEPIKEIKELKIIDIKKGDGDVVEKGATIDAHYTGALAKSGVIFQSSIDFGESITFGLDQVIAGWTQGVPGMKVGGKRRLLIPAEMAYGKSSPDPTIPANSDMVFDIELKEIV